MNQVRKGNNHKTIVFNNAIEYEPNPYTLLVDHSLQTTWAQPSALELTAAQKLDFADHGLAEHGQTVASAAITKRSSNVTIASTVSTDLGLTLKLTLCDKNMLL